ncbi:MAG: M20/M25/M40 family metallo-hydrolase [Oscillospiraceae bacterium]|jgi:endoglucanase|nr:M20/M25/M40 family metallo-hydrolase [Oscillospiraceae bacterium]
MYTVLNPILRDLLRLPPDGQGAADALRPYLTARDTLAVDALGSVVWTRAALASGATLPPRLLEAHIDTIALVVTAVLDGGFLRVAPVGGVDRRPLSAQAVRIWTRTGAVPGVIPATPPHLQGKSADTVPAWTDILVDTLGVTDGIAPGDLVSLYAEPVFTDDMVFSPGLDNRAGCAALVRALQLTADAPRAVTAVFATREETSGAGARTASYATDAPAAVAVDVTFATAPDVDESEAGELGGGPMLGVSPVLDGALTDELRALAAAAGVSLQTEVMGGRTGTDADKIQSVRTGIPTALLSIPQRNMHTAAELCTLRDIEDTARVLQGFVVAAE